MKSGCMIVLVLIGLRSSAQDSREASVLRLSEKVFQWEVAGKLDSLDAVLDAGLLVVGSDGSYQTKGEYMGRLSGGNFVHNSISVEESKVTITENTAIVAGKGRFTVTVSGSKTTRHLSYMEVFTRSEARFGWKLLGIKANALTD